MIFIKDIYKQIKVFLRDFKKGNSLKARLSRGSLWLAMGSGVEQGLRLIRNMILTRLLAPEIFGLMAIVYAINIFFESFSQIGIRQAIIQSPEGEKNTYLNAAWFLSVARSLTLYIIAYISAPLIANFYNYHSLIPIMRVVFLNLVFRYSLRA